MLYFRQYFVGYGLLNYHLTSLDFTWYITSKRAA